MPNHLWILCIVLGSISASAQTLKAKVKAVIDPQTVVVVDSDGAEHWVQLAGIIGPSPKHRLYAKAKKVLTASLVGRTVVIEWETQGGKCNSRQIADRCRKLGKVLLEHADMNLRQIVMGLASHDPAYRRYQSTPDRSQYTEAEERARFEKLGLWKPAPRTPSSMKKKALRRKKDGRPKNK